MSDKDEQQSKTLNEPKKRSRREFFDQYEKGLMKQVEDRNKELQAKKLSNPHARVSYSLEPQI